MTGFADQLVERYSYLVRHAVRRAARLWPELAQGNLDDLESIGYLALVQAGRTLDITRRGNRRYVFRCVFRAIRDELRRTPRVIVDQTEAAAALAPPQTNGGGSDTFDALQELTRGLGLRCQVILALRFLSGLTEQKIAELLPNISQQQVSREVAHGLQRIRLEYTDEEIRELLTP